MKAISVVGAKPLGLAVATCLVVVSALAVVYSSYQARQSFSALQQAKRETLRLDEQWGRLLLEQSTWASHARIEHLARTKLTMTAPEGRGLLMVKQ